MAGYDISELSKIYSGGTVIPKGLSDLAQTYARKKYEDKLLAEETLRKAQLQVLEKQTPYITENQPLPENLKSDISAMSPIPISSQEITSAPRERTAIPEFLKGNPNVVLKQNPSTSGIGAANADISWAKATPEQKRLAIGIYNGDIDVTQLGFRERTVGNILANEHAYLQGSEPYQSYTGSVKGGMAKNLAYGKLGINVNALNTGIGHTGDAMQAYSKLQNTDVAALNKPINWLKRNTNNPDIVALDANLNALAGELATIFKGSSGTDQEIKHWLDVLGTDLTPIQANSAITKIGELLTSRIDAIKYQQENVMQQMPSERKLVSPKSEKIMKQIESQNKQTPRQAQSKKEKSLSEMSTEELLQKARE